jgi:hypothetical protein
MLSTHEWYELAWINGIAVIAGATFVFLASIRNAYETFDLVFLGAPIATAFVLVLMVFGVCISEGYFAGEGIGASLMSGLGAALIYGPGAFIFSLPGAWIGGVLGARMR